MVSVNVCQCMIFIILSLTSLQCLKQYVELLIKEGLETAISCPDAACPKRGHLQENEIECMVASEIMQRYKKLQFERGIVYCSLGFKTQVLSTMAGKSIFTSQPQHSFLVCGDSDNTTLTVVTSDSVYKMEEDDAPIKRCPKCKVYIERDEGCAQMMCKNCKHAFCWYCLESLDDDFLLIHYDKGPCRNKLGHSRASVIWHRTQVGVNLLISIFAILLLIFMQD
ncbi:hypothetical protein JD844_023851 [Phrynosoma platyrhinos]|uniref:RING-type domain-containing protein n=1 Tax=Phrynosoma platyrhinos TaxID=52577 RepID=A0ABQ7SXJ7_PHRPL|nr:hypothetical protein JD844_023851 [Phrynosoma platyrhinos]